MKFKFHHVIEEKPFQEFWIDYIEDLESFRMHHFQPAKNCKKIVTNVRRQRVKAGSVAIQHDFTEAMTIQHKMEVQ